jgi:RNA polymerase sigma-70 factor (ECF subfamily)
VRLASGLNVPEPVPHYHDDFLMIGPDFDGVLAAAQAGAEWAFSLLYRDLNPPLIRYFSARVPSAAEDLSAETWLAAARQLQTFRGGELSFRAWLFTIGRRQMIEHWRYSARRPADPVGPEILLNQVATSDPATEVLDVLSAQETVRAIALALTPDQADVVLLRVLAGLRVEQVAEVLGKRPGTVRVLQHKALRRLAANFSVEALTL